MMNSIPTNAEMTFWIILGILAVIFFIALPIIRTNLESNEGNRFYGKSDGNIDDMEDRWD